MISVVLEQTGGMNNDLSEDGGFCSQHDGMFQVRQSEELFLI